MRASRSDSGEGHSTRTASSQLSKHDGHPFEASDAGTACALCGELATHILHHPTRVRAACALRGIDPEPLLAKAKR
jgi:hypothetical protein